MGNFVLHDLIDQGPGMRTVSLPRGRQTMDLPDAFDLG